MSSLGYPFLVVGGFGAGTWGVVLKREVERALQLSWLIEGETKLVHQLTRKDFIALKDRGAISGTDWLLDVNYDHEVSTKMDARVDRSNQRKRQESNKLRMATPEFTAIIDREPIVEACFERWFKRPPILDAKALLARWRREAIDTPHRLAIILLANELTTHDDAIAADREELRALIADLCLTCEASVKRCLSPGRVAILRRLAPSDYREIAQRYRDAAKASRITERD